MPAPPPVEPAASHSAAPELTARALLAGVAIGAVLALGNVYMGLKTGWWDSGNITAAVVGFVMVAPGARLRARRPYSMLENNITQTAAGSAGAMPAALGLLGALPALAMLGHHYPGWAVAAWGAALALFGIVLALPLRRRFVATAEPLPFPTAVATAEVIRAIHGSAGDARRRTAVLLAGAAVAVVITWFRDGRPAVIPGALLLPGLAALNVGVGVSPMLVGVGIMVGARTGLSVLAGGLIAWVVLARVVVDAGVVASDYVAVASWLLWPGVTMMVTSGLVRLALEWRSLARVAADLARLVGGARRARDAGAAVGTAETAAAAGAGASGTRREWTAISLAGLAVVVASWAVFDVHPALGATSVALSVGLIVMLVRAAGETDVAPLGSLGQVGQILLGLLGPARATVNVACASVTAGAGAQSVLMVSAFKTGHLLGAPARGQVRAQLLGALAGLLVALPAYAIIGKVQGLGSAALPAPSALPWKALAAVAEQGAAALPPWAAGASLVAGVVAAAITLLERTRAAPWLPSVVGLSVAFLVPATVATTVGLGAIAWWLTCRARPALTPWGAAAAAGTISGEALTGFTASALVAFGIFG